MSPLSKRDRAGNRKTGGIVGYPLDSLRQEVAFLAFHFHWSYEDLMNMEHRERRRWIQEIITLLTERQEWVAGDIR
jgi:hypothetical protein